MTRAIVEGYTADELRQAIQQTKEHIITLSNDNGDLRARLAAAEQIAAKLAGRLYALAVYPDDPCWACTGHLTGEHGESCEANRQALAEYDAFVEEHGE